MRTCLKILAVLIAPALAAQQSSVCDQLALESRAALIGELRQAKLSRTQSTQDNHRHRGTAGWIGRIADLPPGWQLRPGGLPARSGLAANAKYINRGIGSGAVDVTASFAASVRRFVATELSVGARTPIRSLAVNLLASYQQFPSLDYYGEGPESDRGGRADYRRRDIGIGVGAGVQLNRRLRVGTMVRALRVDIGPGTDNDFAPIDHLYPNLVPQGGGRADFVVLSTSAAFDSRRFRNGPKSGGLYGVDVSRYLDRRTGVHSFTRLHAEAQHFTPLLNDSKVIALRARWTTARPDTGAVVPFYMQPTLGGPRSLRGFRAYRFSGDTSILATAEYRWELMRGLDMALFADAGRVTGHSRDRNFPRLETSYGVGFRFSGPHNVFMRIDGAASREGFHAWLTFDDSF